MDTRPLRCPRGAAWGLCLLAGCLLRGPGEPLPVPPGPPSQFSGTTGDSPELPPPPAPPTPYGLIPLRPVSQLPRASNNLVVPAHLEEKAGPSRDKLEFTGPSRPAPAALPLVNALRPALEKHPREAREVLQKEHPSDREKLLELLRLTDRVAERE